ncbi:unnamed protein product [Thelazia callipaeda]|uniref:Ulp1 protease family, C-terminal catalytic domain containing protein n=1 Tax=Thelazia callipaeda TaxID=103827 RepID=A0A0N5CM98_THECL|nr:unnamed protein product [Thelazia callipaeda]
MSENIGIDSKPRVGRVRRRFTDRLTTLTSDRVDNIDEYADLDVKDLEKCGARKYSVGCVFRDTLDSSIKNSLSIDSKQDFKGIIRRPLTGLFRKSGTHSKNESKVEIETSTSKTLTFDYVEEHNVATNAKMPFFENQTFDDIENSSGVNINHIPVLHQLNFMDHKIASLAKLDDIDLLLLSRFILVEEEVRDEDVPWTWDYLFTSLNAYVCDEWAQDGERDVGYKDKYSSEPKCELSLR